MSDDLETMLQNFLRASLQRAADKLADYERLHGPVEPAPKDWRRYRVWHRRKHTIKGARAIVKLELMDSDVYEGWPRISAPPITLKQSQTCPRVTKKNGPARR